MPVNRFSWINDKLELKSSLIQGLGYHAKSAIKKGETLIVQSGQCIDVSCMDEPDMESVWYIALQVEKSVYYYPYSEGDDLLLDGISRTNHSCDPNAGFSGQISLVAMRDIEVGEEITIDYAMCDVETEDEDPWEPQRCSCGKDSCRGWITGADWKNPELQIKYEGFFSLYVSKLLENINTDGSM